jgi:replicative DNA helicase
MAAGKKKPSVKRQKARAADNGQPEDDHGFAEWAAERELASLEREADRRKRVRQLPGDEFILDEPDLKAIWGSGSKILWAPGEPFMITAKPGAGKTTIGGQLLYHRIGVREGPLLGLPVEPLADGEQALYLAMDRPPQIARSLKRGVTEDDRDALRDRLVVWRGPLPFILSEKDPYALAT